MPPRVDLLNSKCQTPASLERLRMQKCTSKSNKIKGSKAPCICSRLGRRTTASDKAKAFLAPWLPVLCFTACEGRYGTKTTRGQEILLLSKQQSTWNSSYRPSPTRGCLAAERTLRAVTPLRSLQQVSTYIKWAMFRILLCMLWENSTRELKQHAPASTFPRQNCSLICGLLALG